MEINTSDLGLVEVFIPLLAALAGFYLGSAKLREVKRKRTLDIYWKLLELHNSEGMKDYRRSIHQLPEELDGLADCLANQHTEQSEVLRLMREYNEKFHNAGEGTWQRKITDKALARISFLDQAGLLLQRGLFDREILVGLIGDALRVDYPVLKFVVDAHRYDHGLQSMFSNFDYLWQKCPHDGVQGVSLDFDDLGEGDCDEQGT